MKCSRFLPSRKARPSSPATAPTGPRASSPTPMWRMPRWSWGNLGYIATGTAGAFPASNPADKLMDLAYALKSGYRQNALWTMNRKTQSVIRKFKDGQGNYLWQPALSPAASATLLGFPVTEVEHMPDIATDSFALALRRFQPGLSDRRPRRRADLARSLFVETLCAVLHDEARRRRRAELRGDQADEVRRVVSQVLSAVRGRDPRVATGGEGISEKRPHLSLLRRMGPSLRSRERTFKAKLRVLHALNPHISAGHGTRDPGRSQGASARDTW